MLGISEEVKLKNGFLVDSRGIRYKRENPLQILKIKFYEGGRFVERTPANIKEFSQLQRELEQLRKSTPLAWLDAGVLEEGYEKITLPDFTPTPPYETIHEQQEVLYRVRQIEIYKLGE